MLHQLYGDIKHVINAQKSLSPLTVHIGEKTGQHHSHKMKYKLVHHRLLLEDI